MKKFFQNIFWILGWPFIGITFGFSLIFLMLKIKNYRINPNDYLVADRYRFLYKIIKKYLFLKNVHVESSGFQELSKTPYLFIANHKSKIDALALFKVMYENNNLLPFVFLGKQELSGSKLVQAAMELIDSIFIVREDLRQALEIIEKENKVIRSGRSMIIYGEGTRIKKHEMGEFKPGSLRAAYDCAVPIVPVTTYGTLGLRDTSENNIKPINNTAYISCLKPVKPTEFINAPSNNIALRVRNAIAQEYMKIKNLVEAKKMVFPKE